MNTFVAKKTFRINKLLTLELLNSLVDLNLYNQNSIINQALEIGLPLLLDKLTAQQSYKESPPPINIDISSILENLKEIEKSIAILNAKTEVDLLISSSTYQHLLVALASSPSFPKIPDELRKKFDSNLPATYNEMLKQILLKDGD